MPPHSCDAPGGRHHLTVSHSPASSSPPLPQRLPEDVWTHARRDVMHPEPSGPSPGAMPVFISRFISLVRRLNVSLQLKQDLDCLAFSSVSQNNLCCTSPGTQNMLWSKHHVPAPLWMNHCSVLENIICPNFKTTTYSLIHWFNSFQIRPWPEHKDV